MIPKKDGTPLYMGEQQNRYPGYILSREDKPMKRNYNEFRNVWFSWQDKISITILDFPVVLVRKYEWLEKERSNWLVQVMGVDLLPSITRKLRPL